MKFINVLVILVCVFASFFVPKAYAKNSIHKLTEVAAQSPLKDYTVVYGGTINGHPIRIIFGIAYTGTFIGAKSWYTYRSTDPGSEATEILTKTKLNNSWFKQLSETFLWQAAKDSPLLKVATEEIQEVFPSDHDYADDPIDFALVIFDYDDAPVYDFKGCGFGCGYNINIYFVKRSNVEHVPPRIFTRKSYYYVSKKTKKLFDQIIENEKR